MAKLYAIVGAMERARIMLEARTPYLQLRFKEDPLAPHHQEIRDWARAYPDTRIIINDDLDSAVKVGAWGAHLGQEDLDRYTPAQVRGAPLMVGISTHSPAEIQRALDYGAAMLGFGPIFPTGSKDTGFAPQGVERLRSVVGREPPAHHRHRRHRRRHRRLRGRHGRGHDRHDLLPGPLHRTGGNRHPGPQDGPLSHHAPGPPLTTPAGVVFPTHPPPPHPLPISLF